jgi:hypothetical protein
MVFKFGGHAGALVCGNRRVPVAITRLIPKLEATEFGTLWTAREAATMARLGLSAFSHLRSEPELGPRRAKDAGCPTRLVYGSARTIKAYLKQYPLCRYAGAR